MNSTLRRVGVALGAAVAVLGTAATASIEPTDRSQRLAQRPAVMMPYSGVTNATLVPRRLPISVATSMSKPEYSPPCRYPSPGWSAATPIAIVGPCAAPSVTTETDVPHAPAPAASGTS